MDEDWTAIYKSSLYIFSIGLKCGLWLGHCSSRCMFRSLSCWKMNLCPSIKSSALCQVFFKDCPVFGSIHLFLNWLVSLNVVERSIPTARCYHHVPCWDGGLRGMRGVQLPPHSVLVSSHWSTLFLMFAVSPTWLVATPKHGFLWLTFNRSFILATLPQSGPDVWSTRLIVCVDRSFIMAPLCSVLL